MYFGADFQSIDQVYDTSRGDRKMATLNQKCTTNSFQQQNGGTLNEIGRDGNDSLKRLNGLIQLIDRKSMQGLMGKQFFGSIFILEKDPHNTGHPEQRKSSSSSSKMVCQYFVLETGRNIY